MWLRLRPSACTRTEQGAELAARATPAAPWASGRGRAGAPQVIDAGIRVMQGVHCGVVSDGGYNRELFSQQRRPTAPKATTHLRAAIGTIALRVCEWSAGAGRP